MTICGLLCGLHPCWKMRDVMVVRHERETQEFCFLQAQQQSSGLRNGESIVGCLRQYPNKPQFSDGARCQFQILSGVDPESHSLVKFVLQETQCDKSVYVKQVFHGKVDKISRTCLLVRSGASEPALRTGRPVIRSRTIRAVWERVRRGVNTMCPASILASSESPARRPSLRRIGLGRTTWPLLESLV